ncbi:MAG: alginate export family protein, partial [Verrucomicrobiae bacterium]|nr:alginate export family protein [Verrucomicrobiae bacterium]
MPAASLHAGDVPKASAGSPFVTKAAAANRVASIPDYVMPLSEVAESWGMSAQEPIDWLEFGLVNRQRWELRDQDYRTASLLSEDVYYGRTLAYAAVKEVLDPLRLAIEFEDSRRFLSERPVGGNEANHTEILQAYGELFFGDTLGGEAVSARFGRMNFDAMDRRLISRNRYRNTLNAFDGARLRLGDETSPVEIDSFALRPVTRSVSALDESSEESWLYGVTGYVREWSPAILLEPYWLIADQTSGPEKHLHTTGVHGYGQIAASGWDYDWDLAGQWGDSAGLDHRAWASHLEVGHTWTSHAWKPRVGAWIDYASGDRDPEDGKSSRFDSLFGDSWAHYGYSSYFVWRNQIEPAVRLS